VWYNFSCEYFNAIIKYFPYSTILKFSLTWQFRIYPKCIKVVDPELRGRSSGSMVTDFVLVFQEKNPLQPPFASVILEQPNPNPFGWTLYIKLGNRPKASNLPKQETAQITLFKDFKEFFNFVFIKIQKCVLKKFVLKNFRVKKIRVKKFRVKKIQNFVLKKFSVKKTEKIVLKKFRVKKTEKIVLKKFRVKK